MKSIDSIDSIVELLKKAEDAYYGSTAPIMSDPQYDALQAELRRLDPNHPHLSKVGAAPVSGWQKVKHAIPMGSLNKAQEIKDFRDWLRSCSHKGGENLLIMDKLDGASLELKYVGGKFTQAVTRGDGEVGEDITQNALLMKGVVKVFPGFTGYLRGEVCCFHDDFATYFPGQSNPRNTANGTMKRQSDAEGCKNLTVIMFQMLPDSGALPQKSDELKVLKKAGFYIPRWELANSGAQVEGIYDLYVSTIRKSLNYDIDGLVIQFDSNARMESLGDQGRGPKGAVAFKFPHEEKETILQDVIWQVGSSGRITPVATFDSVDLAGAKVDRASLHNITNISQLRTDGGVSGPHMCRGDRILCSRRNEVIPFVEAVLESSSGEEIPPPTTCPSCTHPTSREGEYLVCRGDNCPAQILGTIVRWVQKIGVLHCGEALIEAWIAAGLVSDIADLYTLDPDVASAIYVGNRRAGGSAVKAIQNLKAKMDLDLHVFVGSLGIPLIGRSMAKTIVDGGFDSLLAMHKSHPDNVALIDGVGETKALSFCQGFWERMPLITKLLVNGVTIKRAASGHLKDKTFCLTGFRDPDLQDAIESVGGVIKSGVSKTLDFLILQDPKAQTGKAQTAREYNDTGKAHITLLSIEDAWELVKNGT